MMNAMNYKLQQSGAILITVLIMLVLLTLLGLSTITTSTLEERMAANIQETNRSFQSAESGLEEAYADSNAFSVANKINSGTYTYEKNKVTYSAYGGATTYRSVFKQVAVPTRGSGWDSNYRFYYFELSSEGRTSSGASTRLGLGVYQVGPAGTSG